MHRYPEGTAANMLVFLSLNTATAYPAADTPRLGNPDSRLSLRPFSGLLFVTCHLKAETIMYKSLCLLFPLNTLCESILGLFQPRNGHWGSSPSFDGVNSDAELCRCFTWFPSELKLRGPRLCTCLRICILLHIIDKMVPTSVKRPHTPQCNSHRYNMVLKFLEFQFPSQLRLNLWIQ